MAIPHLATTLPPTSRFILLCPVKVKTRFVWKRLRNAHPHQNYFQIIAFMFGMPVNCWSSPLYHPSMDSSSILPGTRSLQSVFPRPSCIRRGQVLPMEANVRLRGKTQRRPVFFCFCLTPSSVSNCEPHQLPAALLTNLGSFKGTTGSLTLEEVPRRQASGFLAR